MGYSNRFNLSVNSNETVVKGRCSDCNKFKFYEDSNFCPSCGKELEKIEVTRDVDHIINEFREFSEDASYLIDDCGDAEETGSGYHIEGDLVKFSTKYPKALFELHCEWDQGFGDPPTKIYIKNGKKQTCQATFMFPEFDESKMK